MTKTASTETPENRIRRLIYRSSYTGTKETDRLLGAFSRAVLPSFDDKLLRHYEDMLDFGDPQIWSWVSGQADIPAEITNPALHHLMAWCRDRL
ncbi:MAG: succinate dehydrogenase assembly factor 2 [Candidatus Puniceispirillales bacterium WSBS_2018_MAG_OTU23]